LLVSWLLLFSVPLQAQRSKQAIKEGNKAYEQKNFELAKSQYKSATEQDAKNPVAWYNLGNSLFRMEQNDEAIKAFESASTKASSPLEKSNALYNKAVALKMAKKIPECIEAYKQALKLNASNEDARHNLQLLLKQQQQKQQNQKQDQKPKEQEKPKPQKSNISRKQAEQQLQALQQKEKQLQDKLQQQQGGSPSPPDKDW
jgi:Ca-activated chloride channel homolog